MDARKRFIFTLSLLWAALGIVSLSEYRDPEFRPWERLYDRDELRFQPAERVAMQAIGDLGYKTWNRALQKPRDATFSTDRWGYRNPEDIVDPEVVIIGESYVAGAGQSDDETVSARLGKRLGVPVYNFAAELPNAPALFLQDERFMKQRPKVVIWAPVARAIAARPLFYGPGDLVAQAREYNAVHWTRVLPDAVERLNRDNGLVREARFALQGLLGRWRDDPRARELPTGERVLTLSLHEQRLLLTPEQRDVDRCVEMVAVLAEVLEQAGVRFVFSPIPESGEIYPELFAASERQALPPNSFLERLLNGVRERGIEVVDLRRVFGRDRAPYLYLPDDSHWNARAADLAAAAFADALAADRIPAGLARRNAQR